MIHRSDTNSRVGVVALLDGRLVGVDGGGGVLGGAGGGLGSGSPPPSSRGWSSSSPGFRRELEARRMASSVAWNRRRIQNMILVVGPGTPASVLAAEADSSSSSDDDDDDDDMDDNMDDDDDEDDDDEEDDDDDDEDDDEEEEGNRSTGDEGGDSEEGGSSSSSTSRQRNRGSPPSAPRPAEIRAARRFRDPGEGSPLLVPSPSRPNDGPESEGPSSVPAPPQQQVPGLPSLRHGGCINTACWLDAPWRLVAKGSSSSSSSPSSSLSLSSNPRAYALGGRECPTQIITSGDDRVVKVWDVSGAMGTDRVPAGGWNTRLPFGRNHNDPMEGSDWKERWHAEATLHRSRPHGTVVSVASLPTGHRGNVFHATPLRSSPGNILTCGADGCLRLCDMAEETSSVVFSLARDGDGAAASSFLLSPMAFSHLSLSAQTGLLCSETGLHAFDLRLSPREQPRASLLRMSSLGGDADSPFLRGRRACKACALWNPHGSDLDGTELESYYVFAGGSAATVGLLDVRMDASAKQRVVELYSPRHVDRRESGVSVSGLDVSRDGRELLVSYENDQIYAFPIAHSVNRNPTVEDVDALSELYSTPGCEPKVELSSYGGHLNRYMFLKNARYAGPQDEYVLTGSDSGHAWIFERTTGAVVSLLGADSVTCNGVVPHPTLPIFVTYGIDSTAKLWRATPPVDPNSDDSSLGRAARAAEKPYEMSPVAETWESVQALLKHLADEPTHFPENIPTAAEIKASEPQASGSRRFSDLPSGQAPFFGNATDKLPSILRQNMFQCYRCIQDGISLPVEHDMSLFCHRVSVSRLRHQADRLGLAFDAWAPWAFRRPRFSNAHVHPADLVPDFPSDWIKYDPKMRPGATISHPRESFHKGYEPEVIASHFPGFFDSEDAFDMATVPWLPNVNVVEGSDAQGEATPSPKTDAPVPYSETDGDPSRRLLYETVRLLKEAGNEAMKENMLPLAASRYDKAIQYCAIAYMVYPEGGQSLKSLTRGHYEWTHQDGTKKEANVIAHWTPLLQAFIACRLNLALLLLRPPCRNPKLAAVQARAALHLALPFGAYPGSVVQLTDGVGVVLRADEPPSTYAAAKALLAKAYHRLGSAELEAGRYSSAVQMLERSLKFAGKPDALTTKRLQEAKRGLRERGNRRAKRAKHPRPAPSAG